MKLSITLKLCTDAAMHVSYTFLACMYESTGSYFCHPDVGIGLRVFKVLRQSFLCDGQGELSCMWTGLVLVDTLFNSFLVSIYTSKSNLNS